MRKITSQEALTFRNFFNMVEDQVDEIVKQPSLTKEYTSIIEVTMNHPRTAPFRKRTTSQQIELYENLWIKLCHQVPALTDSQSVMEYCKDGTPHLHGWLRITYGYAGSVYGMISNIAQIYLRLMPKRYSHFRESDYYPSYERYRSPMLCLQYNSSEDKERNIQWQTYIDKCV